MHIPDAVLSPITSVVAGAAMLPIWSLAAQRVRQTLGTRQAPMLALGAAFCFTVMMFNIPAPGGTTAHPVAGTLLAVMLGPWAACIGISVALLIQALFFGDGGILAFGANCFTMAFVLPFVGYTIYRMLARRARHGSGTLPACAGIGAYIGILAAAGIVAILLGIQPSLFHEPNGHALYFPFGLHVTLPAMLSIHLVVAGPAEAIVTALAVRALQAQGLRLYGFDTDAAEDARASGRLPGPAKGAMRHERLWIGLLAVVALCPLGLLAKGDAWGEWNAEAIKKQTEIVYGAGKGYTPRALELAERHGYRGVHGLEDYASGNGRNKTGYLLSGLLGVGAICGLILAGGRVLSRREDQPLPPPGPSEPRCAFSPGDLPDWLKTSSESIRPDETEAQLRASRHSSRFLTRTLAELTGSAAAAMTGEIWTRRPGALQKLDPRARVLVLLGLIAVTACVRQAPSVFTLYALALILGMFSQIPVPLLLRRVWLAVPLFVGALALPAALNCVTPGRELMTLWEHPHLAVTAPGLLLAVTLTLRAATAVTFAALLTLTTPWNDLLSALRALYLPRVFLSVLAMTYRYIIVLVQAADEMFTARRSRTIGAVGDAQSRRFIGGAMALLFGKSLALSEEVHAAMISRGYTGEAKSLRRWKWRALDTAWMAGTAVLGLLAWYQG